MSALFKKLRVKLFRHGDCDDEAFLRGITNSPLSPAGGEQLKQQLEQHLAQTLNETELDNILAVVSSPLDRCQVVAKSFSQQYNLPFQLNETFQERDFGDWDGQSYEWVEQNYPELLEQYLQDALHTKLPNAETYKAFKAKNRQGWVDFVNHYLAKSPGLDMRSLMLEKKNASNTKQNTVWLVTHGGVIRTLLADILKMDDSAFFNLKIETGCVVTIDCFEHGCQYQDSQPFCQLVAIEQMMAKPECKL